MGRVSSESAPGVAACTIAGEIAVAEGVDGAAAESVSGVAVDCVAADGAAMGWSGMTSLPCLVRPSSLRYTCSARQYNSLG